MGDKLFSAFAEWQPKVRQVQIANNAHTQCVPLRVPLDCLYLFRRRQTAASADIARDGDKDQDNADQQSLHVQDLP